MLQLKAKGATTTTSAESCLQAPRGGEPLTPGGGQATLLQSILTSLHTKETVSHWPSGTAVVGKAIPVHGSGRRFCANHCIFPIDWGHMAPNTGQMGWTVIC